MSCPRIIPTWKCRYCTCVCNTARSAVYHELYECIRNPRNMLKAETCAGKFDLIDTEQPPIYTKPEWVSKDSLS